MAKRNSTLPDHFFEEVEEKFLKDKSDSSQFNETSAEPFLCTGRGLPFPQIPDDIQFSSHAYKVGRGGKSGVVRSSNQLSSRQQIAQELLQAVATLDSVPANGSVTRISAEPAEEKK